MNKLKVALIGLGYWGNKHLEFYKSRKDIEITYFCDLNTSINSDKYLKKYENINISNIDFVDIVTPEKTHYEIANYFLNKGTYVFLEKPVCTTKYELELLLLNKNFKKIMIGYLYNFDKTLNLFFNKYFTKLTKIKNINIIWCDNLIRKKDCDIITDLGSHIFSILLRFSKKITIESSVYLNKQLQDSIIQGKLNISEKIIPFSINLSWNSPIKKRQIIIDTYSDTINIDCMNQSINSKEINSKIKSYNTLDLELDYFINIIHEKKIILLNSLEYSKEIFDLSNESIILAKSK